MFRAFRAVSSSLAGATAARCAAPSTLRGHLLTGGTALIAVLALLAVTPLQAAPDAAMYATARARFQPALDGDNSAIDPAATQLKALSDAEPADPVLRAYAGAATSMRARTTMLPWRKMGYAEDGLAQLDKALAQITPVHEAAPASAVPAALETRYIAASSFLAMPDMFHRGARGEQLLTQVLTAPALATAAPEFQSTVWLYAGKRAAQAGRKDEAREWLAKVAASNTSRAATAQQLLKGL
jgi:tetratricopeptide (TPR) repeat protein